MSSGQHDWKTPQAGEVLLITAAMPWRWLEQKDDGSIEPCLPGFIAEIVRVESNGWILVKRAKDGAAGTPLSEQAP
jgi:hypothetical protein